MDLFEISLRTELRQNPLGETSPSEAATIDEQGSEQWYVCRQCGNRIVPSDFQIAIQGLYRHVFANPSGIIFEILCFSQAGGYSFSGVPSNDFAWFAGYSWRIVVCIRCLIHLGWFFSNQLGGHFFGLITGRLRLTRIPAP